MQMRKVRANVGQYLVLIEAQSQLKSTLECIISLFLAEN